MEELKFDSWQLDIIRHLGHVTTRCGRQVGKSTTAGKRRADQMKKYPKTISLIIAPSQRQSSELYTKTMHWLYQDHYKAIEAAGGYKNDPMVSEQRNIQLMRLFEANHGIFNEIPTKTTIVLKHDWSKEPGEKNIGSKCYSLPAGKTGTYLRTYALDFLDIDEAAYVPEPVYIALEPMLAVSEKKRGLGWKSFYSTPYGKGGFFFDAFTDDDFKQVHISAEDCPRISKSFLAKQKKKLTKAQYAQEWMGEFVDEYQQYFSSELIKSCMTFMRWNYKKDYKTSLSYFYGHDYAGPGQSDNASVIAEMQNDNKYLKIVEPEEDEESNTTIVNRKIVLKDEKFKFRKLFVDSGGFGCGPTDELTNLLGRRVIGLDNAKKSIGRKETGLPAIPSARRTAADDDVKNKLQKEDLYSNAKSMMERGEVSMINNLKLLRSLKSMTYEYTPGKKIKIYGKHSHLSEAFVRVCWAVKEKGLRVFLY